MRFLRNISSCFALALVITASIGAQAAAGTKVTPVATPVSEEDLADFNSRLGGFTCRLGPQGVAFTSWDYIIPPDDRFFVWIEPEQCLDCQGTDTARLATLHVVLNFLTPCTIPISYTVVAADTGCTQPDESIGLCGTTDANLVGDQVGLIDFALPFPDSCRVTHGGFIRVNFKVLPPECNVPSNRPRMILASGGCPTCKSWNYFEDEQNDLCVAPDPLPGEPMIWAEAWACYVPNRARTWGQLKIRYR